MTFISFCDPVPQPEHLSSSVHYDQVTALCHTCAWPALIFDIDIEILVLLEDALLHYVWGYQMVVVLLN